MDDTQRTGWQKRILLFLTSQCITLFGSTLVQMALVWYATMQTSSGAWVAAFTVCSYLPQFLISFVGGAVGTLHGIDFQITDPNRMCVNAAKVQLFLVDALLSNNAVTAKEIIANYKPQYPSIKAYLDAIDALTLDKDAVRYDEKGNAIVDFQN